VGAMIEGQTPNTESAALGDRAAGHAGTMAEALVEESLAARHEGDGAVRTGGAKAAWNGQTVLLTMYWCVRVDQKDALACPTPLEKNQGTKRPRSLELQETPSQPGLLVHLRPAPIEALLAKRHLFTGLLWIWVK